MAWDKTPMYAYGGLSRVTQMHHVCIIGLPGPNRDATRQSLGMDLNTWVSSNIYVDVAAVNRTLRTALQRMGKKGQTCWYDTRSSLTLSNWWKSGAHTLASVTIFRDHSLVGLLGIQVNGWNAFYIDQVSQEVRSRSSHRFHVGYGGDASRLHCPCEAEHSSFN